MRAYFFLLMLLLLTGCEYPTEPQNSNPYDPKRGMDAVPNRPTDLFMLASSASTVTLSWTDHSSFENAFWIERATAPSLEFEKIDWVKANVIAFTDSSVSKSRCYFYRVLALNRFEFGQWSDTLMIKYDAANGWTGKTVIRNRIPGC